MNISYNCDDARYLLTTFQKDTKLRKAAPGTPLQEFNTDDVTVKYFRYPPSHRLVACGNDGSAEDKDDAVFKVAGILCGKNLPPVDPSMVGRSLSRMRNLRQHVKITGLGQDEFQEAKSKLDELHRMFEHALDGNEVLPFDFLPYEGHPCVESHARYFTDRSVVPYEANNTFLPNVDPQQTLSNAQPESFIHAIDNQVEYCVVNIEADGSSRYRAYSPERFKVGDIVEVAFACVAIPIKEKRFKLILQLRAVTLLSSTTRIDSEKPALSWNDDEPYARPKRRSMFLDSTDVESARKKLRSLDIWSDDIPIDEYQAM
ncbi:hypothetical protein BKA70DRAFT_1228161 [Coprinopsis sp. MPI-PUGE-AT-0042]|nr:hypothetical protein BKA70DRAFT_1228161 [Coprinopsis sp. MPI-PUGE-AT-0042]